MPLSSLSKHRTSKWSIDKSYLVSDEKLNISRPHKPDYWLLILMAILMFIGLIVIYSIGPALAITNNVTTNYFAAKQALAVFLGLVAFFIAIKIPIHLWKKYYKILLVIAFLTTVAAIILPVNPSYPAHRWVRLGSFSFQSVEVVKFAVTLWVAGFFAIKIKQGQIKNLKAMFIPLTSILVVVGIIIAGIQSDLGSMAVITAIMVAMAFVAGLPLKRLMAVGVVIVFGLIISIVIFPYRLARIETYLNPQSNCQGSGYQACQSLISVGSGGIVGLGLGKSVQAFGYVPEASNDSIFAIFSEKFGFIGSVILIGIFAIFFSHMKNIAERLEDNFLRLVVVGIFIWLCSQTLINIGAMIGLFPLKGITLPFISYGGTSIVFSSAAVGLVYQISRYTSLNVIIPHNVEKGSVFNENSVNRRRLRGAYHSNISHRS